MNEDQARTPLRRRTLTVKEVAPLIGIGKNAAYQLVRSGRLRAKIIGRRILVPIEAVDEFLNSDDGATA